MKTFWEDVMEMRKRIFKSIFGKAALATAALGGIFLFAGVSPAQAREYHDHDRPDSRYDDYRLHRAISHYGYDSHEANYWRFRRHEAFEHGWRDRYGCWHRY